MSAFRTHRPASTTASTPTRISRPDPTLPSLTLPSLTLPSLALPLLGLVLAVSACASPAPSAGHADGTGAALGAAIPSDPVSRPAPTLYDDIGGEAGVASLVERFIREIATDDRIRGHYRDSDMGRFYRMMQVQMCEVTGGGCTYEGDDMRRTHGGMNITPTEFNGIVEALMRAMDAENLPVGVQNRILAVYAPMREDIIDH